MTAVTALLTNQAYGYPARGARRRRKPTILACLHQTANATATAIGERTYANRPGSWGPSATAYIDRGGTIVRAIHGWDVAFGPGTVAGSIGQCGRGERGSPDTADNEERYAHSRSTWRVTAPPEGSWYPRGDGTRSTR